MRAFCANVSASGSTLVGFWADDMLANGFAALLPNAGDAKGLAWASEGDLTPNSVSPRFTAGLSLCLLSDAPVVDCLTGGADVGFEPSVLIALNPRTLPSFLLHAFLLHVQTYSLLSCPGKRSTRSA